MREISVKGIQRLTVTFSEKEVAAFNQLDLISSFSQFAHEKVRAAIEEERFRRGFVSDE